ncbi:hypothetical protein, variant [Verruconis gallopava]|nr:hypothetical protein, variant [Verruconis gallopava]KIW08886.1 hypothetical protein, variant [Verruconis gallopava]
MFLIEGDGRAVLFTGDIRSEPWWVDQLVQNPVLIPYTGCNRTLDCIYLDTTNASKNDHHREFPSKADGVRELTKKVLQYPDDTVFYFDAWTFGYEKVWVTLASVLNTQVHLDHYRWGLYKSIANASHGAFGYPETAQLCGFQLGNHQKDGCLTSDPSVRLHSCEKGALCPVIQDNPNVVFITPIVSRLPNGAEMHEFGTVNSEHRVDQAGRVDFTSHTNVAQFNRSNMNKINIEKSTLWVSQHLSQFPCPHTRVGIEFCDQRNAAFSILRRPPSKTIFANESSRLTFEITQPTPMYSRVLPKSIRFPYSRHSSYAELCGLVQAFRPRDVHPCTVDEETWCPDVSMRALFGHLCSGEVFAHDEEMMSLSRRRTQRPSCNKVDSEHENSTQRTQSTTEGYMQVESWTVGPYDMLPLHSRPLAPTRASIQTGNTDPRLDEQDDSVSQIEPFATKRPQRNFPRIENSAFFSGRSCSIRKRAYMAALGSDSNCSDWDSFGGLSCVKKRQKDIEL